MFSEKRKETYNEGNSTIDMKESNNFLGLKM